MKLFGISFGLLVLAAVVYAIYFVKVVNPQVIAELQTAPDSERAEKVMLLMFADGKTIPVNYLRDSNVVYAGADFGWWKPFRGAGQPVRVLIKGETLSGHARAVLDNDDFRDDIFLRLRPTVPLWIPDWAKAVLVEIQLEPH